MKKIKLTGKLSLNKETIAKLNDEQMGNVKGGGYTTNNLPQTQCRDNCDSFDQKSCGYTGLNCCANG